VTCWSWSGCWERIQGSVMVRKASGADAPRIAEIHARSWRAAYRGIRADELLGDQEVCEKGLGR
jgi:hypothetical protein